MKHTIYDRLLRRELGGSLTYAGIKGLYGDRAWIDELDIVDELGGHSGCVNALSWSSSGRLLASGSDDKHLNIHSYQPESSVSQFSLSTTVSTGHTANIFSVKFMPSSNDNTLVTCAGDSQVRVFDLEYTGQSTIPSSSARQTTSAQPSLSRNLHKGVKYLSSADTNARVYRSHANRVKRIVTESSPYLFLTCSEDGEVRQFDLRLPSSAYPAPRGGRGIHDSRQHASTVPPPLISYQRYHIDLNTISCSPSQPHYIALGGAHLHCFLHDRRMIGRDLLAESGNPGSASPISSLSSRDNNLMGQATRCVRKFAPSGQKRMRRTDNGHITACKISDANPNEMIVSWSGDHIYSFDLVRSPDATESESRNTRSRLKEGVKGKARESRDRKRKRKNQNPSTFDEDERDLSSRETGDFGEDRSDLSLRVRYENGQSEDISMGEHVRSISRSPVDETKESLLNDSQKRSLRIAKRVAKIRELMFSSDANSRKLSEAGQSDYTAHTTTFTSILGLAATNITEMDDIMRTWKYPMNPYREDVLFQQTLRRSRDLSRRFVQAAGTLAKVLGGRLQTVGRGPSHVLEFFDQITPAPEADEHTSQTQIFSFEFLRAIVLWLQGGLQTLLQGFKRPENRRPGNARYPVPDDAGLSSIDDHIIPYLLQLAQEHAILNVDASRFEIDENRKIFRDETVAVIAFSQAIKTPLEDLSEVSVPLPSEGEEGRIPTTQDRKQAFDYWGFKVGRSLLMRALEGINFQYVDGAFGGIGTAKYDGGRSQDDNDPDELEDVIESIDLMEPSSIENEPMRTPASQNVGGTNQHEASSSPRTSRESTAETDHPSHETDAEVVLMEDLHNELADQMGEDYDEDEDGDEYDEDEEDDDEDGVTEEDRRLLFKSASDRGKLRESVEKDVPCSSHVRQYRGHCNIQTVKDVNYFGLQDEYVVSGSDSGHVFIWDKKTSELINILEGDEEVVNVVQGHPYEPILAVSGIDHTVKIFSPDGRAQQDAAAGVNLSRSLNDSSGYTSTLHPRRARRAVRREEQGVEGLSSRKRMHDQYKIISQNDAERQGGMRDAFITRDMLAQLAAGLRASRGGGTAGEGGADENGVSIILDENCTVM